MTYHKISSGNDYVCCIKKLHKHLGIDKMYLEKHINQLYQEVSKEKLVLCGKDCFNRDFFLTNSTFSSWKKLKARALDESVVLEVVSAFRSVDYQVKLIEKKLLAGKKIHDIITVNAPPGFSEHHTGRALDITTPEEQGVLTESFENTAAFQWLCKYAADFGFTLSYPRENIHGYVYEPWHWCYQDIS
ncbi:D-alanyl-D-alanine carboxypeptidase family protein [Thiotrichales bacterium 19S3-7]|nr:D-alanyl-D-alanine carboxypeptidase family protein [Thiotrichales bacterium 19S3-7]MCF6802994.1 D-alanyl-D-alanine carboxypeptidase family protein [Thiotrichales bacterium 19S3-11]